MNKKAQGLGIAIIVAITIFIVGILSVNFLKADITTARDPTTGLNCSGSDTISDGTKLTCLAVDLTIPYFIILVFSISGGFIVRRFLI